MKLKILSVPNGSTHAKATIHASGKLGFSKGAIEDMGIKPGTYLRFASNEDDKNDRNLYIFILEKEEENSLKIIKAGAYYYVNTKPLFDKMGVDYKRIKIIFDIVEIDYEGTKIYKFVRREKDRKKK